jgi:hypothetical protein
VTGRVAPGRSRIWTALAVALLCALAVPALAAASGAQVIRDCADDGRLSRTYSQSDLRKALEDLPTDIDEYTDCRDVIRRAQLGVAGGGAGGGAGPGAAAAPGAPGADPLATATPEERAAFEKAVAQGDEPVELDGRPITAGALGGSAVGDILDLPTPLLVVLALLAVGGLGAAAAGARKRVLGRRAG